jgi:hypothetical protein
MRGPQSTPRPEASWREPIEFLRPALRGVVDARDFDGVLLDLVNRNIRQGRKDELAPSFHASGASTVGKVFQCLTTVRDSLHRFAGGGRVVFLDVPEDFVPGRRRRGLTSRLPSGLKQPLKPFSYLLVSKVLTSLQSFLASLHGFHEMSLFVRKPADGLLRERVGVTASLGSEFGKFMLLLRGEMYFHTVSVWVGRLGVNGRRIGRMRRDDRRGMRRGKSEESPLLRVEIEFGIYSE